MKIKIKDREVTLYFGVRFVRELDKVAGMNVNGASLGMGLTRTLPALETGDPVALANVLYAASYDTNPRVSQNEIDEYMENCKDLDKLYDRVMKEAMESNIIKATAKKLKMVQKKDLKLARSKSIEK